MELREFKASLTFTKPPAFPEPLLLALWQDAKGDWQNAHEIAQEVNSPDGSWVHAYLHRKEGDVSNASYWYAKAKRRMANVSLDQEWDEIVSELLK